MSSGTGPSTLPIKPRRVFDVASPKPRKQCATCPWKVGANPREIPNGYSERKHAALRSTIADGATFLNSIKIMACPKTAVGREQPCVGWLANQLGPGNNLALRLAVFQKQVDANFELDGEQHERFEDTLPKRRVRKVVT